MHAADIARRPGHQMAAVVGNGDGSLPLQRLPALQHLLAIAIEPQGLHQVHHPAAVAGAAVARRLVVAQQRQGEARQLLRPQPQPQGDRQLVALGREEAAHHHGETELVAVEGRQEGQVVVQQEAVGGPADGDVELAGQVARPPLAEQALLDGLHQRAGVEEFLRIEAGQGVGGDVAGVVVARLVAGEPHGCDLREQRGHVLQQQAAQLQVLAGGDVGAAVLAAAIHRLGQHRKLIGPNHPAGQPQPHHEAARGHRTEEDPQPLEVDREGGFVELVPAGGGELGQAGLEIQAAQLGLGALHFAEGSGSGIAGGAGGRRNGPVRTGGHGESENGAARETRQNS